MAGRHPGERYEPAVSGREPGRTTKLFTSGHGRHFSCVFDT